MSRGLGAMEREVLATIGGNHPWAGKWVRLRFVANIITMDDVSDIVRAIGHHTSWASRYPSVKRAARSLERKGLIERRSRAKECYVKVSAPLPQEHLVQRKDSEATDAK